MAGAPPISLSTMTANGEVPTPAPLLMASWWGNMFNRLYLNNVNTPDVKSVNVTVDLLPERRVATIDSAWVADPEVRAGDTVPVKVFLRPYRGERIERDFTVKIPDGLARGDHRILLSDADTVNRMQNMAGSANRYLDLPQIVSLFNQERSNNKLYVSLVESTPTAYYDDKTLPSLPSSVLNVMQVGESVEPVAGDLAGNGHRADGAALRLHGDRQLLAADPREMKISSVRRWPQMGTATMNQSLIEAAPRAARGSAFRRTRRGESESAQC
jgi:hypothetical protein